MNRSERSRFVNVVAGIMMISGIGLVTAAAIMGFKTKAFVSGASRAEGVVVEMKSKEGEDTTLWAPVVRYADSAGAEQMLTSSVWSSPPDHRVGDKVTVLVSRSEPKRAEIESFLNLWLFPVMLGGFGLLDLLIGIGVLVAARHTARGQTSAPA